MNPILPFLVSAASWLMVGLQHLTMWYTYVPLCGGGGDTDNHDGSIGQDLLEILIVLAFVQAVAQLLGWEGEKERKRSNTQRILEAHLRQH